MSCRRQHRIHIQGSLPGASSPRQQWAATPPRRRAATRLQKDVGGHQEHSGAEPIRGRGMACRPPSSSFRSGQPRCALTEGHLSGSQHLEGRASRLGDLQQDTSGSSSSPRMAEAAATENRRETSPFLVSRAPSTLSPPVAASGEKDKSGVRTTSCTRRVRRRTQGLSSVRKTQQQLMPRPAR